jgi:hypothetical protein
LSARSSSCFLRYILLTNSASSWRSCLTVSCISSIFFVYVSMMFLIHFSMYYCSVFVSRFLEIESRNSSAFSLAFLSSLSIPSMSKSLAPVSVISVASYLAAFKLCNFEDVLKSIIWVLLSSSSYRSVDFIALYII